MQEIIIYSIVIILLPLIPAYILYVAIPAKEPTKDDAVEGMYQGLNIKLRGAFAGYFILAIFLSGFIGVRLLAGADYEYWTVEGKVDERGGEPKFITFSIEPPDQQKFPDGKFVIKNVPIQKGSNKNSTLVLTKMSDGKKIEEVVELDEGQKPYQSEKKYEIEYIKNTIYIKTPITFSSDGQPKADLVNYSSDNAVTLQPIKN
jgi:hypothetical protein